MTPYSEFVEIAKRRQALPNALLDHPAWVRVIREPTLLVGFGDTHWGADGTDYDQLTADIEHLAAAKELLKDRMVIAAIGDYIDGYLPSGTPQNPNQVLSPVEQRDAAKSMLDRLRPDFVIEGDHDLWHSKTPLQHNWLFEHCLERDYQYAQWGGSMTFLDVDNRVASHGLVRHRYKGSVSTDHLKPHKNLHLDQGPAAFTMMGHFHSYPGVYKTHSKRRHEGTFHAVQVGTYKQHDEYGKKLGFFSADYGVPALLIYPDGHLVGYDRYEDGVNALL